jgi:hypothetical protein
MFIRTCMMVSLSAFPGGQVSAPGGAAASAIGAATGSDALSARYPASRNGTSSSLAMV